MRSLRVPKSTQKQHVNPNLAKNKNNEFFSQSIN